METTWVCEYKRNHAAWWELRLGHSICSSMSSAKAPMPRMSTNYGAVNGVVFWQDWMHAAQNRKIEDRVFRKSPCVFRKSSMCPRSYPSEYEILEFYQWQWHLIYIFQKFRDENIFTSQLDGNILQVISYQDCYVLKSEKTFILYNAISFSYDIFMWNCELWNEKFILSILFWCILCSRNYWVNIDRLCSRIYWVNITILCSPIYVYTCHNIQMSVNEWFTYLTLIFHIYALHYFIFLYNYFSIYHITFKCI